uniref:Uncharacterized protein n=1 Tax=Lotharella globosa TaxID=91324 RepID=A0A7S4DVD4_9EUKA
MTYENSERVFHPNDVPQKAKEARAKILALTAVPEASRREFQVTTKNGVVCGRSIAPWDDTTDHKHYAQLRREHDSFAIKKERARKEKEAIEAKKLHGNWNKSVLFEKNHTGCFGKVRKNDPEHIGFKTVDPKQTAKIVGMKLTKHKTLLQREIERTKNMRKATLEKRKEEEWQEKCKREQAEVIWDKPRATFDHESIHKELEATYSPDTLSKFLKTQELQKQRNKQRKIFEETLTKKKMPNAVVRPANLSYSIRPGVGYVSKAGSATVKIGGTKRGKRFGVDPTKVTYRYEHLGKWQKNQFADNDTGEEEWAWSCCMNAQENSKGCSLIEVHDKTRWQYD